MDITREDILRELELLPVWRLRAPALDVEPVDKTIAVKMSAVVAQTEVVQTSQLMTETIQSEPLPNLRMLMGEEANYLFLLEIIANNAEAETLLQNMLRAISVKISTNVNQVSMTQIAQYQPKIIIVFGQTAAQVLLDSTLSFDTLRLNQHQQHLASYNGTPVVITYHPADLLQHLPNKAKAWDDLRLAMQLMRMS